MRARPPARRAVHRQGFDRHRRDPDQRGSPIFAGRMPDTDADQRRADEGRRRDRCWPRPTSRSSPTRPRPTICSPVARTTRGTSTARRVGPAAANRRRSPRGCRRSAWGPTSPSRCAGRRPRPGSSALKPTHGRIPMTGVWPRVPRRYWHVGPMARSVRDIALAYSLLAGPDGADGFSISSARLRSRPWRPPDRPLRVGWLVDSGSVRSTRRSRRRCRPLPKR